MSKIRWEGKEGQRGCDGKQERLKVGRQEETRREGSKKALTKGKVGEEGGMEGGRRGGESSERMKGREGSKAGNM